MLGIELEAYDSSRQRGAYEGPQPDYEIVYESRQYSFKENSPLHHYLLHKAPNKIWHFGVYRLNYIILVLLDIIKQEKLFDRKLSHIVVCNPALGWALKRTWLSINSLVYIILPQLTAVVKKYKTGMRLYHLVYRTEIDSINALLNED